MLQYPRFPTQSAYGKMPAFPTTNYTILTPTGNITLGIPNIALFPLYLLHLFFWLMGWAGAFFEYIIIYTADIIGNVIMDAINTTENVFIGTLDKIREATAGMGIFAIPIQIAILGILFTLLVIIIFGIVKGAEKIGEMLA